jgi:hypothetical protein
MALNEFTTIKVPVQWHVPDRKVDIKDNHLDIKLIPMISTWDQVGIKLIPFFRSGSGERGKLRFCKLRSGPVFLYNFYITFERVSCRKKRNSGYCLLTYEN